METNLFSLTLHRQQSYLDFVQGLIQNSLMIPNGVWEDIYFLNKPLELKQT